MVFVSESRSDNVLSLDDFLSIVDENVDASDFESLIGASEPLGALANNRDFLLPYYHAELARRLSGQFRNEPSAQSTMLHSNSRFAVRSVIWPSYASSGRKKDVTPFAYSVPHNHNFHFITVGYFGPGYTTDVYRCDTLPKGIVGESVTLKAVGTETLEPGKVMGYEALKDVHTQYEPDSLSISLNLLETSTVVNSRSQYTFDLDSRTVSGSAGNEVGQTLYFIELFRHLNNCNTIDILSSLASRQSCVRTQAQALSVLRDLDAYEFERVVARVSPEARTLSFSRLAAGDDIFSSGFHKASRDTSEARASQF